ILSAQPGGEPWSANQGSHPFAEGNDRARFQNRQYGRIPPHAGGAVGYRIAAPGLPCLLEIVMNEQGKSGLGKIVELAGFVALAGLTALQIIDGSHGGSDHDNAKATATGNSTHTPSLRSENSPAIRALCEYKAPEIAARCIR